MDRTPIHPGEVLADDLEALDMSAAELSRRLKVPANRVTEILNGQRAITADTALRLAHFFGTSAQFWLNLQNLDEALPIATQIAGALRPPPPQRKCYGKVIRIILPIVVLAFRAEFLTWRGTACAIS